MSIGTGSGCSSDAPVIRATPTEQYPIDLSLGSTESDDCAFLLDERHIAISGDPLTVDLGPSLSGPVTYIEGEVSSHLLHVDSVGSRPTGEGQHYDVTMVFDDPVLGFITEDESLVSSDARFGVAHVDYGDPAGSVGRGLEFDPGVNSCDDLVASDHIELVPGHDGRAVRVCGTTGVHLDHLRVLTGNATTGSGYEQYEGVWVGDWGDFLLREVDSKLRFTYTYCDGVGVAVREGDVLIGRWRDCSGQGPAEFRLLENGQIDGRWAFEPPPGQQPNWRENWDLVPSTAPPPQSLVDRIFDDSAFVGLL